MGREVCGGCDAPTDRTGHGQRLGRLARSADIKAALRQGRGYSCPAGVLNVRRGGSGGHRLCVIISRKVGKAVIRNRIRRRVREVVRREIRSDGQPADMTFRVRPAAAEMRFDALREWLIGLMAEAGLVRRDSIRWR